MSWRVRPLPRGVKHRDRADRLPHDLPTRRRPYHAQHERHAVYFPAYLSDIDIQVLVRLSFGSVKGFWRAATIAAKAVRPSTVSGAAVSGSARSVKPSGRKKIPSAPPSHTYTRRSVDRQWRSYRTGTR